MVVRSRQLGLVDTSFSFAGDHSDLRALDARNRMPSCSPHARRWTSVHKLALAVPSHLGVRLSTGFMMDP
jgi:hypothetical protein